VLGGKIDNIYDVLETLEAEEIISVDDQDISKLGALNV
jgi:hypothetical protein